MLVFFGVGLFLLSGFLVGIVLAWLSVLSHYKSPNVVGGKSKRLTTNDIECKALTTLA